MDAATELEAGVADADVVVVCTPVSRIADDVRRAADAAPGHVLVTDAGSSKRQIVEAVERHPGRQRSSSAPIRLPVPSGVASIMHVRICSKTASAS